MNKQPAKPMSQKDSIINVHWVMQHAEDTPTVVQMTREDFLAEVAKDILSARLTTYIPVDSHNVIRVSTLAIMYPLINVKYMKAVTNLWVKLIDQKSGDEL